MATAAPATGPAMMGGGFLVNESEPAGIFTPEDFTPEHHAIAKTTAEFFANEVAPNLEAIQHHEPGVAIRVLRKSAELGLTAVIVAPVTVMMLSRSTLPRPSTIRAALMVTTCGD